MATALENAITLKNLCLERLIAINAEVTYSAENRSVEWDKEKKDLLAQIAMCDEQISQSTICEVLTQGYT